METNLPKPRRWFRFSLRTMFLVMTVFCCWPGYQLNWIRQRHTALERHHPPFKFLSPRNQSVDAPWSISILGESGAIAILIRPDTDAAERESIQKLFPESQIFDRIQEPPTLIGLSPTPTQQNHHSQ
jgi:hypothetical protein